MARLHWELALYVELIKEGYDVFYHTLLWDNSSLVFHIFRHYILYSVHWPSEKIPSLIQGCFWNTVRGITIGPCLQLSRSRCNICPEAPKQQQWESVLDDEVILVITEIMKWTLVSRRSMSNYISILLQRQQPCGMVHIWKVRLNLDKIVNMTCTLASIMRI